MSHKINIRSVKKEWLDSRCLAKISKYSKLAHDHDGAVLDLRDDDVLHKIRDHASQTNDDQLVHAYKDLKAEIKNRLVDPTLSRQVSKQTIPDYLIAEEKDARVPRSVIIDRWFRQNQ